MSKPKSNSFYFFFSMLVVCLLASACGTSVPKEATTYIGTIHNSPESARIGIVIENLKFVVYICSLDDDFNASTGRWFVGDLETDGTVDGRSSDGVKVNGSINYSNFTGIITNLQGEVITFQGKEVPIGGPAGLYRGVGEYDGQAVIVGAIVEDETFIASTVQVQDKIEFITPITIPPFRVDNSNLILTFGALSQRLDIFLVSTLQGLE